MTTNERCMAGEARRAQMRAAEGAEELQYTLGRTEERQDSPTIIVGYCEVRPAVNKVKNVGSRRACRKKKERPVLSDRRNGGKDQPRKLH